MIEQVIDCDVHHLPQREMDLVDYLPARWQELANLAGRLYRPIQMLDHPDGVNSRLDAIPGDGTPAGSSYPMMREQLLDPYDVGVAHLNWGSLGAVVNGEYAAALCNAENRWFADTWLEDLGDERLCGAISVPMHDPVEAAAEIRRAGQNPRFASAILTYAPFARPIGHPVYHPIYEAAAEMDLPVYIHVNIGESNGGTGPQTSGTTHSTFRFDLFVTIHHPIAVHLTSLIANGVFDRFPTLRVMVAESGLAWFPGFVAALDSSYELLRRECPSVKRWPSEYLRDHVFLTTQPCEAIRANARSLIEMLSQVEGIERMLCFSSDYPHWDNDISPYIEGVFPSEWHDGIFRANPARALRLPETAR